jgi:hypothetical protein
MTFRCGTHGAIAHARQERRGARRRPRIEHGCAQVFVEAFVQSFDGRVLIRFTGLDEVEGDAVLTRPLRWRAPRAILPAESTSSGGGSPWPG